MHRRVNFKYAMVTSECRYFETRKMPSHEQSIETLSSMKVNVRQPIIDWDGPRTKINA